MPCKMPAIPREKAFSSRVELVLFALVPTLTKAQWGKCQTPGEEKAAQGCGFLLCLARDFQTVNTNYF